MMIYLDYAATTPTSDEALNIYNEVAKNMYGNPSSLHDVGTTANNLLELCRNELATILNGQSEGVFFTSGGSESNILAIRSLIRAHRYKGNHLITTVTEHSSIINLFKQLECEGFVVTYLPVDHYGQISIEELVEAVQPNTILASIHYVNSEIGTIQPVKKIGPILRQKGIIFHSDCVQAFGKIPIDMITDSIDSLSISSHKIYGPKGVGAVYLNPAIKWESVFPNTTHEKGLRPGTINVPGIAAFVTAAKQVCTDLEKERQRLAELRQLFVDGLKSLNQKTTIEGHYKDQLPNIIGLSINGIEGQYTMLELNRYQIAISTGSACQVGKQTPSKTMIAIGKSPEVAKQFIRLSLGKFTTKEDIDYTISSLKELMTQFKNDRNNEGAV